MSSTPSGSLVVTATISKGLLLHSSFVVPVEGVMRRDEGGLRGPPFSWQRYGKTTGR